MKKRKKTMTDNHQNIEKIRSEIEYIKDIEELERIIKEKEKLLIIAESKGTTGWIPLAISVAIVITMGMKIPDSGMYLIITGFGLLYLGFNIWRLISADKQKKELKYQLQECEKKKAELQASPTVKE
jgi:hypothetical protein